MITTTVTVAVRSADAERVMTSKIPERMCLVCRTLKTRDQLLRFVKSKEDGSFLPNAEGRLPGKGIYFCRTGDCLQRMQKERRLRRQLLDKLSESALEWIQASREMSGDKLSKS
jgi:predicted RNA-binding protein YlxR (DUF448 family)